MPSSERCLTVMGATGYTGCLISAELDRRGVPFAVAGRNRAKLEALSRRLGGVETLVADVADPASLEAMAARSSAIINCAGPFTDLGEPVVLAAIHGGAHYLDTTGEQPFVKAMRAHDAEAKKRGVAVVPAMGFEIALTDCAAALAAAGFGDRTSIHVTYAVTMHPSQGTQRTVLRMLSRSGCAYVGGDWVEEAPARHRRTVEMPPPAGRVTAISFPSAEIMTIPAHEHVREVRAFMALPAAVTWSLSALSPVLAPVLGILSRPVSLWVGQETGGPSESTRRSDHFQIAVDARGVLGGRARARRVLLSGNDPYGLTAVAAADGAHAVTRPDFTGAGLLSPAQIVTPREFLESLRPHGVTFSVSEVE